MSLSLSELHQFEEQGFVVARGLLDYARDLRPVQAEYEALLDSLARQWYAEGKLSSTFSDLPFGDRLVAVIRESGQAYYQHFDISLPQTGIEADTPMHLGEGVFQLLRNPRLLDVAEQIVGPEVYSNPVQHVRIKPPERLVPAHMNNALVRRTDWHQDTGVILPEADESNILTVWLPVTRATAQNGCLAVIPGSHRGELRVHCPAGNGRNQVGIPAELIEAEQRPVPMAPGDVLFMHRQTVHSSLPNVSDEIRWSFDLRYNPVGQATGRPWFPGFIARSRSQPETELTDARAWGDLWRETRATLAARANPAFNRWDAAHPACA